jgi:hypothetical protein
MCQNCLLVRLRPNWKEAVHLIRCGFDGQLNTMLEYLDRYWIDLVRFLVAYLLEGDRQHLTAQLICIVQVLQSFVDRDKPALCWPEQTARWVRPVNFCPYEAIELLDLHHIASVL